MKFNLWWTFVSALAVALVGAFANVVFQDALPRSVRTLATLMEVVGLLMFVITAAVVPIRKRAPNELTWKQKRLVRRKRAETDRRDKLVKNLNLQYLIDQSMAGPLIDRPKVAPEDWLNRHLQERMESFRVRVRGDIWLYDDLSVSGMSKGLARAKSVYRKCIAKLRIGYSEDSAPNPKTAEN